MRAQDSTDALVRGLYAIVDPDFCGQRDALALADAILAGGCAVLQLRAKRLGTAELAALCCALRDRCRSAGVPFVVNDHVALAKQIGVGVHLGQHDMPLAEARALLGHALPIGISTHDLAQAKKALAEGADLIGFGPVFATTTKANAAPVVGLAGLREVCRAISLPVVAIGGITAHNVDDVAATGAAMAAAITALAQASDPRAVAAYMHQALLAGASVTQR